MNTLNFLQRLQPHLQADDVTTASGTIKLAVLTAINDAAVAWAKLVPVAHKLHADGCAIFPAPATVSVGVTANSTAITGLTAADIGKTITLPGDGVANRVVSATKLRMPYVGSTGTVSATLYGDAYALPANFERMASPVFWERATERREIGVADMGIYRTRRYGGSEIRLADPEYYAIETGQTWDGAGAPRAIMRLLPIPATVQRMTFDYSGPPARWAMTDFGTARELGLADEHWTYIADLALARLCSVPGVLHPKADPQLLMTQAATAQRAILASSPGPSPAPLFIGTPFNY